MRLAERLRRLDDRVLGPPKPLTSRSHRNGMLVALAGTLAVLGYVTIDGDIEGLPASVSLLMFSVAGGFRWFRALQQEGRWQGRETARRTAVGLGLLLLVGIVCWYAALLVRGDEDPRYTPEQCELARSGFLPDPELVEEIRAQCAEDGQ